MSRDFVMIWVWPESEEDRRLYQTYRIKYLGGMVFLDAEGDEVKRLRGTQSAEALISVMEDI